MTQNAVSGYASYINYGFETTYGSAASGTRVFGHGQKITVNRKRNIERIFGVGARNATNAQAKKYEGSATSFFRAILGSVADSGAGPYAHTYTEANTIPSFSIVTGTELGTNDEVAVLLGCKISSGTITTAVGELAKVRLETLYSNETLATSGISSQVAETFDAFTFAQGSIELPSGSVIGSVQSIEVTFSEGLEQLWGLGSYFATSGVEKTREYNFRMTVAFKDVTTLLTKFFGASGGPSSTMPAEQATLKLTWTNSGAGVAERSIVATFANINIDTETLPKDVNEIIKEDVDAFARSCTSVVWTNNTAVDAGAP
jgi:hypothetical protein